MALATIAVFPGPGFPSVGESWLPPGTAGRSGAGVLRVLLQGNWRFLSSFPGVRRLARPPVLFGITPKTAETHIERIYAKSGASTRATITLFAMQNGLLDTLEPIDL